MVSIYEYKTRVIRVVDGDTVRAELDLGLDVRHYLTLRLEGINAPEMGTDEGVAATKHLEQLVGWDPAYTPVVYVRTVKDRKEKYGRYRAILYTQQEDAEADLWPRSINQQMVDGGHAQAVDYR